MKELTENSINVFKDRLYKTTVPELLKKGDKVLKPLISLKQNEQGKIAIQTKRIIHFFQKQMKNGQSYTDTHIYFSNLYTLLQVLSKDAEHFAFESDVSISEKEIQEADDKKTIEYLTINLIITYFNHFHQDDEEAEEVEEISLTKDLKALIQVSNAGRDYKTLVGNTLASLVKTLETASSWKDCLNHINEAALVCKLVGAQLPQIEKQVLSNIILNARNEIKSHLSLLVKILNTKEQALQQQISDTKHHKLMAKLDAASRGVLNNIDTCLGHVYHFMKSMNITLKGFLGTNDDILKHCLVKIISDGMIDTKNMSNDSCTFNYSTIRFCLNLFFDYDYLVIYMRTFQNEDNFQRIFNEIFRTLYDGISKEIDSLKLSPSKLDMTTITLRLSEANKAADRLTLSHQSLKEEKEEIRKKFISLLKVIPFDQLDRLMAIMESLRVLVTGASEVLMEDVRKTLVDTCFFSLRKIDQDLSHSDLLRNTQQTLHGYAIHYKPIRFFYQIFWDKYIYTNDAISPYLNDLLKSHKSIAFSLLTFFSDPKVVSELISEKQITQSEEILNSLQQQ